MSTFIQGYAGAVISAVGISVSLSLLIRRASNLKPSIKNIIQRFVPLPAVMTASTLNVILMRLHELDEGINVVDKNGKVVGSSKLAAKKALKEMAVTRALLPIPLLTIPSICMASLEK
jgi:sideroflexin-5